MKGYLVLRLKRLRLSSCSAGRIDEPEEPEVLLQLNRVQGQGQ